MNINVDELRIFKLRQYLFEVINKIVKGDYQINANMLSDDINNYSLDRIPTQQEVENWVTGEEIHQEVYSFRSRNAYSQDTINNLLNIGFFEIFEQLIFDNNRKGILPEIIGIEEIKCLNSGTMLIANTNSAEFDIQIQIKYII